VRPKNGIWKLLRICAIVVVLLFGFLILHGLIAWCVMHIPADSAGESEGGTTKIFVHCDAVHSEIILPVTSHDVSFRDLISYPLNDTLASQVKYISFAWGDLHFFRHTPHWEDLTTLNAFRAAIGIDSTALHVNPLMNEPDANQNISFMVTADNFRRLAHFIQASIARQENGVEFVDGLRYGENDFFIVSKGVYSMFYNCNSWVNDALKYAGCPASVWTIFPAGIEAQFPEKNH
jgi:uncharacterized protein (TIGR02117 family)